MQLIQKSNQTHDSRYPSIFKELGSHFHQTSRSPQKILSFGCSNGSECRQLLALFPKASVYGCDMPEVITEARRDPRNQGIVFFDSNRANIFQNGPYDIITAFSVLCRFPESRTLRDLSETFPFRRFNQYLNILTANLRPEGLLGLYNCNYFFEDSDASERYSPLGVDLHPHNGFCDRFDRHGKKIARFVIVQNGRRVPPGQRDKSQPCKYYLRFKRPPSRTYLLRTCLWQRREKPEPQPATPPDQSGEWDVLISCQDSGEPPDTNPSSLEA